jgi:hypothetical protein
MPRGSYERTEEHKAKLSASVKKRFENPDYRKRQNELLKKLRDDPELAAKRKEAATKAFEKSDLRKWIATTGCSEEQYYKAYTRWSKNRDNHSSTAFSMEQEIARSMDRPDGKVVVGHTRKVSGVKIQANGEVPVPVRRKRRLPPAPDASAVPPPMDGCWTEDPLPCDTELVDEAFMFQVRKSLVSLHAKINRHWGWVDELD